jgi:hypothetical protein
MIFNVFVTSQWHVIFEDRCCFFTYGKNKQNKLLKNAFFVVILEAAAKKSRILIRNPVYGFKDPDPYQNVTDPENWLLFSVWFCWLKRVFLTVLRIRNKIFGSSVESGSGLKLVSDSNPGFESGSESWIRI